MKVESNLLKGSLILLVLTNLFNLFNLLFQVFVAHRLSVELYGLFTALFSVIYIFGIFSESIQLTTAKKIAKSKSIKESKEIVNSAILGSLKISLIVFSAYLIILLSLHKYIGFTISLILLNGCIILFSMSSSPVFRGILQGQKRFTDLGLNMVSEGASKLLLGLFFLFLGFQIYGAFGAIVISMFISLVYGLIQTKKVLMLKKENFKDIKLLKTFKPEVILLVSCIMLLFMLDVFIATIILPADLAGYYAIASTIAKTAFIGTHPISKTMLSHLVSNQDKNKIKEILKKSLYLLLGILLLGIIIVYFFSNILVFLFSGADKEYAASILPIVFLAVSFISISNLVINYKIALDKTNNSYLLPIFIILIIISLALFSSTLLTFSIIYLLGTIIFLIASIVLLK